MFKFVVLFVFVASASAANKFGQNNFSGHHQAAHHTTAHHAPVHHAPATHQIVHRAVTSDDVHAEVNSFSSDVRPDGFQYAFDTTNGISAAAAGDSSGSASGNFAWTSPEGLPVAIQYVADENGFQPSGDVLPTPHPIPEAILRALEYIRTHPHEEDRAGNGRRF